MFKPTSKAGSKRANSGVAAVELAVSLPLLVLCVLGSIEITNGIFLRQGLHVAAYEGAKELSSTGGTLTTANAQIGNILSARSIVGASVTMTPNDPAQIVRGTNVTVRVTAPAGGNSPLRRFLGNRILAAEVVMRRN